ncbi:MAG: CoA transferase, partial [Candidatus Binataceae bacterium]
AWTTLMMAGYQATRIVPGPAGSTSPAAAPYEAFQTSDGWIQIAAGNNRLFAMLCEVLSCRALADDQRFLTNADRVSRRAELHEILEQETQRFAADQLMGLLRQAGVPASVINTLDKVFADEQVNTLGMLPAVDPIFRIPEMKFVDVPVTINGERSSRRLMPPRLGEHTDEVLRNAGYSAAEIAALRIAGAIG